MANAILFLTIGEYNTNIAQEVAKAVVPFIFEWGIMLLASATAGIRAWLQPSRKFALEDSGFSPCIWQDRKETQIKPPCEQSREHSSSPQKQLKE